jgi:hypothetical protein
VTDFINIADIVDKETGKTFRQLNMEKTHKVSVGALVEVCYEVEDGCSPPANQGIRLHVIECIRDCDGTPLYVLGLAGKTWYDPVFVHNGFSGFSEDNLKVIKEPTEEILQEIEETQKYYNAPEE